MSTFEMICAWQAVADEANRMAREQGVLAQEAEEWRDLAIATLFDRPDPRQLNLEIAA